MKSSLNPLIPANAGIQIKYYLDSRLIQEGLNVARYAEHCVL